ncbi:MAG: hypothetical protein Q4G04_02080 [bacterium]|nr:hypothetical protein [bacterium]
MKKVVIIILLALTLVGCQTNSSEVDKTQYLEYKKQINETSEFLDISALPFTTNAIVTKISDEMISYAITISNPQINLNNISALLIHNQFTEELYPSVGLFNEKLNLLLTSDSMNSFVLVGYLETMEESLDIEFKLLFNYVNDNGQSITLISKFNSSDFT